MFVFVHFLHFYPLFFSLFCSKKNFFFVQIPLFLPYWHRSMAVEIQYERRADTVVPIDDFCTHQVPFFYKFIRHPVIVIISHILIISTRAYIICSYLYYSRNPLCVLSFLIKQSTLRFIDVVCFCAFLYTSYYLTILIISVILKL